MHEFKYREKRLYCEEVNLKDIATRFGTPVYVYSYKTLIDHYLKLRRAFRTIKPLICFSVKANSNLTILRLLVSRGAGLDIVSGGELFRAQKIGCPPSRVVYASVGKLDEEIKRAMGCGILCFNVESIAELENINSIAGRLNKKPKVALRINPDVKPKTHEFITTGESTNKFGIDFKSAYNILFGRRKFSNLRIVGLHIHIGSQIAEATPFIRALQKVSRFIRELKKRNIKLEYLNIGGGLGIVYDKEKPQTAEEFAKRVLPILKRINLKVILEPGRFIVGNAGVLISKVLYVKKTEKKKFIIVDAAMNDLMRPALYGAYHKIEPLRKTKGLNPRMLSDLVGPICESGDFLAKSRDLPELKQGDLLAVMAAGAYGFSMSSNYNSRRRCAEVIVKKDKTYLLRKRETYQDLVKNEKVIKL